MEPEYFELKKFDVICDRCKGSADLEVCLGWMNVHLYCERCNSEEVLVAKNIISDLFKTLPNLWFKNEHTNS